MYCKNCGKQIPDDSKFCSHCGSPITLEESVQPKPEAAINLLYIKRMEKLLGVNISKQLLGIYLVWFLLHFILFLLNWDRSERQRSEFFPFSDDHFRYYDFSEFIVYTVVPIAILIILNLFKSEDENSPNTEDQSKQT